MPRLKLNEPPYYNTDQLASAIEPDDILNCYLEGAPATGLITRRRPGMQLFGDLGTNIPGQGIFEWEAQGIVVAVSGGMVYKLKSNGASVPFYTATLHPTAPVQFSDGAKLDGTPVLYFANGKLGYSVGGSPVTLPTDTSTPTSADHVVYINLRFLANVPGTDRFLFTDTNPSTGVLECDYWSSSDNPLTVESRGDDLLGLWVFLEEVYAWGSQGLEIWQDDGVTPFVSVPQATSHVGLEASNSVVIVDNTLLALCVIDGSRCVVRMAGRTPQVISQPIESVLAGYETVSDAVGQLVSVGGVHVYLLQFPTEGMTWAYNIVSNSWVPWGTFDETMGVNTQFIGQHSVFVKAWNKHLIMSRIDGKIYEFDRSLYTDAGIPIKAYRRTIWEDHGSSSRKRSQRLRVKLKRGATTTGAVFIRWADNGEEEWSPYIEIAMYPEGKRDFIADIPRLGMYQSRRYEFNITDDAEMCLVWADEEIQPLRF